MAGRTVYVVVGSVGDYSERVEWVAGVFDDKAAAIEIATAKLREARAADAVNVEYQRRKRAFADSLEHPLRPAEPRASAHLGDFLRSNPKAELEAHEDAMKAYRDAMAAYYAAIDAECGPCPKAGDADDYTVVEVGMNTWGRWENVTDVE